MKKKYNESAQDYLETILMLSKTLPVVRAVDIATELDFKKSSVSVAMKNLRERATYYRNRCRLHLFDGFWEKNCRKGL